MFDIIKTVIEKIFSYETNITDYERMENKYKVGRKKFLLIVFFLILLFSFNSSVPVLLTNFYSRWLPIILVSVLIIFLILPFIISKRHVPKLAMVVMYIIIPMLATLGLISLYYEGFTIFNFILAIMILLFTTLMYSSAYLYIRDRLSIGEEVKLTFVVSEENEPIEAKLISITRNGDYIIQPINNENEEIFLNKDHVRKVIFNKSS